MKALTHFLLSLGAFLVHFSCLLGEEKKGSGTTWKIKKGGIQIKPNHSVVGPMCAKKIHGMDGLQKKTEDLWWAKYFNKKNEWNLLDKLEEGLLTRFLDWIRPLSLGRRAPITPRRREPSRASTRHINAERWIGQSPVAGPRMAGGGGSRVVPEGAIWGVSGSGVGYGDCGGWMGG